MKNVSEQNIFIEDNLIFSSIPAIIGGFIVATVLFVVDFTEFAVAFFFLSFISAVSSVYSYKTVKNIQCNIMFSQQATSVGESVTLKCKLMNTGILPLLNGMIRIPMNRSSVLDPENSTYYRALNTDEFGKARMYQVDIAGAIEIFFPILRKGETLEWETDIIACKRGEEQIEQIFLYAGDLLGFKRSCKTIYTDGLSITVYVQNTNVNISPFLTVQENSYSNIRGVQDDISQINFVRNYEVGDNAKHINWKLFAKDNKLRVNVYDKMRISGIHFIIDGESFNSKFVDKQAFELTLKAINSLIITLKNRGLPCGITLPKGNKMEPITVTWQNELSLSIVNEALARYFMINADVKESVNFTILQKNSSLSSTIIQAREQKIEREEIQVNQSQFDFEELIKCNDSISKFYYFTYDVKKVKEPFSGVIPEEKIIYVSYKSTPSVMQHKNKNIIYFNSIVKRTLSK